MFQVNGKKQASPIGEQSPKVIVIKKLTASFVAMLVTLFLCPLWPKLTSAGMSFGIKCSILFIVYFYISVFFLFCMSQIENGHGQ